MHREMHDPTPALDAIVDQGVRPRIEYLSGVIARMTGGDPGDDVVLRCVASIQSQALSYVHTQMGERLTRLGFKTEPAENQVEVAARHITAFSIAGVYAATRAAAKPVRARAPPRGAAANRPADSACPAGGASVRILSRRRRSARRSAPCRSSTRHSCSTRDAARRLYDTFAAHAADPRLPLPPAAEGHRREPPVPQPVRDLAGRRSLQVARDARQRRRRALLHRRRRIRTRSSWPGRATVPHTLRNPLYHWTHLELKRYFGIDELLDETTAPAIWERANEQLATDELTAHGILQQVRRQGASAPPTIRPTTAATGTPRSRPRVWRRRSIPTFRPDRALNVHMPEVFNPWVDRLAAAANIDIARLDDLLDALRARHEEFHDVGGRLSTTASQSCLGRSVHRCARPRRSSTAPAAASASTPEQARALRLQHDAVLRPARRREGLDQAAAPRRAAQQQHARAAGARAATPASIRSATGRRPKRSAATSTASTGRTRCRRSIVYNLNPADNYALATMIGNFQDGIARRQDPVRQRLVVPRSEGRHGVAAERALERRAALPLRRHAHRFALVHVVPAPRIFPPGAVQPARARHGERRAAGGRRVVGRLVEDVSFRNAAGYFRVGANGANGLRRRAGRWAALAIGAPQLASPAL